MKNKKINTRKLKKLIKETIEKNLPILQSLKDYGEGKKTISTTNIKKDFPSIQVSR